MFNPILNSIGITYFNYLKIYNDDCSRELLTNNPEWIDHFYKNSLFNSVGAVDIEHLLPKGYFLWSELDCEDPVYLQGRDFFNIDNGISFIIKRNDVTYLYIFAASKEEYAINNFYIGNIDLLQRFIHYFNDKARPLIREASNNRIYLPSQQKINQERINNIVASKKTRETFLEQTQVNRYFLLNESDNLYLTKKQADCARLFAKGYTSKHIAREMSLSHRTIEGYIIDIKNKLQASLNRSLTKQQTIQILRHSNIQ
ncbi:transcription regulator protein, response regulator containing CheY-like receiver domain and HTH DNA-binding domain [Legionella lansingensis]|uniref:Bacterial regulatory protein, luxR family n=1 Tax=Legionella lansingensis TaxID=45067 RepID=A0A0W0VHE8_9GAMM|nr:LuxR C-terminal-related transcriptional regulator [Legionella lansingensis]KTD19535.1 Bacterial regulatory protein, luxR family [Legionella lansingensis]SNV44750.1 transcription regulator protein, response regulator containing CheY-like receiver domain and HTH DNA-binding domain [Legionella lansingensis]